MKSNIIEGLKGLSEVIGFLAVLDLLVVMGAMIQIASNVQTPHINFWDAQIRFVINLLK
jgi:hypothetical protein